MWLLGSSENETKTEKTRLPFVSSNWTKKYQLGDKDPYGLYLFDQLAKSHLDTAQKVEEVHSWQAIDTSRRYLKTPKTFMFIGDVFAIYENELDSLMEHIEEGSTLFMSFNDLREEMYDELFNFFEYDFDYAESINVFAFGEKYEMMNLFQNDTIAREWYAFGLGIEPVNDYKVLSSFMEINNFIEFPYGKGRVLLHCNPNMFYNYQLKRKAGFNHTDFVLNQLSPDNDILHMEFGRVSEEIDELTEDEGNEDKAEDSYLRLIFEHPTLLIAWLLMIFAVILFIIFRSKRTRPMVEYIPKKKDMTMAFAETITSIYFAKRNPYGILQVLRKNFYSAVQRHFFVDLSRREGTQEIQILAEKSNIDIRELTELIEAMETKEPHTVDDLYVTNVQKQQHRLYKQVGIITDKISEEITNRKTIIRRSLFLPLFLIFGGVFLIIFGMYYLTLGMGMGIIFWPLGISTLVLGILRISSPYLVMEGKVITHYSPFKTKKEFKEAELVNVQIASNGATIIFTGNRKVNINYWDVSRFDKKQFEAYMSKINTM